MLSRCLFFLLMFSVLFHCEERARLIFCRAFVCSYGVFFLFLCGMRLVIVVSIRFI